MPSLADAIESLKVRIFEAVISGLTDTYFPLVRTRKHSTEAPWITHQIRKLWKKKLRLYKKRGKCRRWHENNTELQESIIESREEFVEAMLGQGAKGFFTAAKALGGPGSTKRWSVTDIFENKNPRHAAGVVLEYFGNIGDNDRREEPNIQRTVGSLPLFATGQVADILKNSKKTKYMVQGDPQVGLIRTHAWAFDEPVTDIYNAINITSSWPKRWKTEYLTIIPKNPNPADLSESRIISCTLLLSKILEGQLLMKLWDELQFDERQYGGIPGSSMEHLLVDMWDTILEAVEGGEGAVVILKRHSTEWDIDNVWTHWPSWAHPRGASALSPLSWKVGQ